MAGTTLTKAQLDNFYDVNIAGSFGSVMQDQMAATANILNCIGKDTPKTVNCTVEEIVPAQWGES